VNEVRLTIVTIPPSPLCGRLTGIRLEAATLTGSRAALLHPPHVTLRTGALVPERGIKQFAEALRGAIGPWRPFSLHAQGLFHAPYSDEQGFERHMVAWRIPRDAPLMDLHARLCTCTRYQRRPQPVFEPHLTLAYEDLDAAAAESLIAHARENPHAYPAEFSWLCANVTLCRQAKDCWEPVVILPLSEERL
jgi:2'-5' RNA ligase